MRKLLACLLLAVAVVTASASVASAERVRGYYRQNGTYVQPYNRSDRNDTVQDNYSYEGNYNPYTGQIGTNYYRNSPSSEYYGSSDGNGYNNGEGDD